MLCFHPRHDLTLALMGVEEIQRVVKAWQAVYEEEGRFLRDTGAEDGYVQIFEVGRTSVHPRGVAISFHGVKEGGPKAYRRTAER